MISEKDRLERVMQVLKELSEKHGESEVLEASELETGEKLEAVELSEEEDSAMESDTEEARQMRLDHLRRSLGKRRTDDLLDEERMGIEAEEQEDLRRMLTGR